jgi:hypothetical protein
LPVRLAYHMVRTGALSAARAAFGGERREGDVRYPESLLAGPVFGPGRPARVLFFPIDHHPIPLPKAQTCNQPKQVPRKGTLNPAAKDTNRGARAVRWKFKELIALLLKDTPEPALPHPDP